MQTSTTITPSARERGRPCHAVFAGISTPVGDLTLVATTRSGVAPAEGLTQVLWESETTSEVLAGWIYAPDDPILAQACDELERYFAGSLRRFQVPLCPAGTPFQLAAWSVLQSIPFGETISYSEQAAAAGNPKAVRAIGVANGANPLPIVIPCHRVIGRSGQLRGFGGGVETKRRLLEHEASCVAEASALMPRSA